MYHVWWKLNSMIYFKTKQKVIQHWKNCTKLWLTDTFIQGMFVINCIKGSVDPADPHWHKVYPFVKSPWQIESELHSYWAETPHIASWPVGTDFMPHQTMLYLL